MGTQFNLAANGDLDLSIIGVIGDGWDAESVTAKAVRKALASAPKAETIRVHVDSPGGSFFEGLAIYQMLQEHQARVEVTVGARAASAASLVAMAGDEISLHETSTMLVHNVWTIAIGEASELRKVADDLDLLSESAVTAYAARTDKKADEIRSLMAENRYMGADEALKLGFCTKIRKAKKGAQSLSEREVRAELEEMRGQQLTLAGMQRIAAMAPPHNPPAPEAPEATSNEDTMKFAMILAALGLPEGATEEQAVGAISQTKAASAERDVLLREIGADSVDAAKGTLAALKGATERAEKAETELAETKTKAEQQERDGIVAKLRAEGKVTPAQEKDLLPTLNLAGLKAFAATAPKVLGKSDRREPGNGGGSGAGKRWEDMTAAEQRQLWLEDEDAARAALDEYNTRQRGSAA